MKLLPIRGRYTAAVPVVVVGGQGIWTTPLQPWTLRISMKPRILLTMLAMFTASCIMYLSYEFTYSHVKLTRYHHMVIGEIHISANYSSVLNNMTRVRDLKFAHPLEPLKDMLQTTDTLQLTGDHDGNMFDVNNFGKKVGVVIIVSRKRSGSSFLGELFNQNQDVFYLFEPLQWLTYMGLRTNLQKDDFDAFSFDILNATSHCDFIRMPNGWLYYAKKQMCYFSKALWTSYLCSMVPKSHSTLDRKTLARKTLLNLTNTCKKYRYIAIKTIRLNNISMLKRLITTSQLNFKIIHLVRDPRATMNSRMKLKDPNVDFLRKRGKTGDEVTDLCQTMHANLARINKGSDIDWLRNHYRLIRYEDIAESPRAVVNEIYRFLEMPIPVALNDWVETNTLVDAGDEYSHTRNAKNTMHAWRQNMSLTNVQDIQNKCRKTMRLLGYKEVNSLNILRNPLVAVMESLPTFTASNL